MKKAIACFALGLITTFACAPTGECVDDGDCGESQACRAGPEGDNICIQLANTGDAGPQPEVEIVSFQSSSESVAVGETVTLSWEAINASSCSLEGAVVESVGQSDVLIENNRTMILTCQGEGGPAVAEVSISVPATVIEFSVTPTEANEFQEVTISWSTVGTENCALSAFGNALPIQGETSGVTTTSALFDDDIVLSCDDDSLSQSLPISVARIASLIASPEVIAAPQPSSLSWTPENVTACDVEGGVVSGDSAIVNPETTTTYTVQCTGYRDALIQKRVEVGVLIESFTAQNTPIASGEDAVFLFALGNGVQSCELDDGTSVDIASQEVVIPAVAASVEHSLSCTSERGVAQSDAVFIEVQ